MICSFNYMQGKKGKKTLSKAEVLGFIRNNSRQVAVKKRISLFHITYYDSY